MSITIPQYLKDWWSKFCPDPRVNPEYIDSGIRPTITVGDSPESSSLTSPCQYWVKGLSSPCQYWNPTEFKCTYSETEELPSGYGVGLCDGLGRREWCSKYFPISGYTLESYTCILPCIEKSGSGKQMKEITEYISYRPWKPLEIKGYNSDESGVALCDGMGMGRGAAGVGILDVKTMREHLPVCKHYKPQMMGFGAVVPRPYHSTPQTPKQYAWKEGTTHLPVTLAELHDGSPADPLVLMDKRLPYAFGIYNLRARFQKCAHWDADFGSDFYIDDTSTDPSFFSITIKSDPSKLCKCESSACEPYKTYYADHDSENIPWIISNIWAKSNSIICNGAKPECPCYTGKWIYCVDENMADGMRITADQIMELRYWTSSWASQEEYDTYFTEKPGPTQDSGFADETTPNIYTFTYWKKLDPLDPNESIMMGKKHHMCMPAPLNSKSYEPDKFVELTEVEYPKAGRYEGTHGPSEVAFPTLVRELQSGEDILPDINIIYPYSTTEPWTIEPCNKESIPDFCFHDNNLMEENPKISIVGYTTRYKEVYAINLTYLEKTFTSYPATQLMRQYIRLQNMPEEIRDFFYGEVKGMLYTQVFAGNGGFVQGVSDENGYFSLNNLSLKNNALNEIYILCDYDGTNKYCYKVRKVLSRYFGAMICQSSFNHSYSTQGSYNSLPEIFSPPAKINGQVEILGHGNVQTVHAVYKQRITGVYDDITYYSYCVNEVEVEEKDVIQWVQIGSSQYLWVELGNLLISYLWPMEIEEAYLKLNLDDEGKFQGVGKPHLCDAEQADLSSVKIALELVYPNNQLSRKTIPPDAFILKAPEPMSFFNEDWILTIKYKFRRLETVKGEKVVFPDLSENSGNIFKNAPYSVIHFEDTRAFTIESIVLGTIAVMAKISDEYGRIQAAAATKMLLQGHKLDCRNVDILYSYAQDAQAYEVQPNGGNITWIGAPRALSGQQRVHGRTPLCGDHLCPDPDACIGYMWYPFNSCNTIDFYNVYTPPAFCCQPITEADDNIALMGTGGWRWGLPDEYTVWATEHYNWLNSCAASFSFFFAQAQGEPRFIGKAFKRGVIPVGEYMMNEWDLPPYGLLGREMVERWLIKDHHSFITYMSGVPTSVREYMPYVLTDEDLIQELSCFSPTDYEGTSISFFPIISTMLGQYNFETSPYDSIRYRFDDILEIIKHSGCTYPEPVVRIPGGPEVAIRYGLKDDMLSWVWPERWVPIERNLNEQPLEFLDLRYPEYKFDNLKVEHRFTLAEGEYEITLTPPTLYGDDEQQENSEEDSKNSIYPSICINGQNKRYFKIVYDSYDGSDVEWMDESSTGEEGSSGGDGSDEPSIYEKANNGAGQNGNTSNNPNWMHDFNTLFSAESSSEKSDDRKMTLDTVYNEWTMTYDTYYGYYNQGLIASIPKNTLTRLPIDEVIKSPDSLFVSVDIGDVKSDGSTIYHFNMLDNEYITPTRIVIKGRWGFNNPKDALEDFVLLSKPGVLIAENYKSESQGTTPEGEFPGFPIHTVLDLEPKSGYKSIDSEGNYTLENFTIDISLSRLPTRMTRYLDYFQVKVYPQEIPDLEAYESLSIDSIDVYIGKYVERTEKIFSYERLYLVSLQDVGDAINADGVETKKYRTTQVDNKGGGQYFPAADPDILEDGGKLLSKTNMVVTSKYNEKDEEIKVSYATLKKVEKEEQMNLYIAAYDLDDYDTLTMTGIIPPYLLEFIKYIRSDSSALCVPACTLTSKKIPWEYDSVGKSLNQKGTFFQPGGHYFAWGPDYLRAQCLTGGPIENVYADSCKFIHHKHGGGTSSQNTAWMGHVWTGWVKYGETEDGNFVGYLPSILENMMAMGTADAETGEKLLDTVSKAKDITGGL